MGNGPAEGSDAAIYTELARANLLRMRGDYKEALAQCRAILHKFPNNVSANQLLGDLCIETGDLEQAKEWYELALDIAPNHPQLQRKLAQVRQKLEHAETEGLVEQLGLPSSKPRNGLLAVAAAVLVIGVGAIAYVLGTQKNDPNSAPAVKRTETNAPQITQDQPKLDTPNNETTTTTPPSTAPTTGSSEETSLAQVVGQRSSSGGKLMGLVIDPRTGLLTLTFRLDAGDDKRLIAADLAGTTFDNAPNVRLITLRAVVNGAITYVADARREAYEETRTDAWKQQNGEEPATVAKHILSQEWPAEKPQENPPPEQPTGETTAGP